MKNQITSPNTAPGDNGPQGQVIPPHKWPKDSVPDENLYSLNVTASKELVWDEAEQAIIEVEPTTYAEGFNGVDLPDFPRQSGTYTEIQKEAQRLNNAQDNAKFRSHNFFPHPIQKLAA